MDRIGMGKGNGTPPKAAPQGFGFVLQTWGALAKKL